MLVGTIYQFQHLRYRVTLGVPKQRYDQLQHDQPIHNMLYLTGLHLSKHCITEDVTKKYTRNVLKQLDHFKLQLHKVK